jgi:hypothetical protein
VIGPDGQTCGCCDTTGPPKSAGPALMAPLRLCASAVIPSARRRGSVYVLLLGVSVILAVIGLSGALASRVQTRSVQAEGDWGEAQVLAASAAEHALAEIAAHTDWRTRYAGVTRTVPVGRGTMRWYLKDEKDGDLANNPGDPFLVVARGQVNRSAYGLGLVCSILGDPLPALKASIHASGKITVGKDSKLTVTGGAISTNDKLDVHFKTSEVHGDVEAADTSGQGTIDGKVTVPAPPKQLPGADVLDLYRNMATALPAGTDIKSRTLSPTENPWGAANPNGVYYLDAGNKTIQISDSQISGTLIVRCKTLVISGEVLLAAASSGMPALIVAGDVQMSFTGRAAPPGQKWGWRGGHGNHHWTPGGGQDQPSEIDGLVHVMGDLDISGTAMIRGAVLCDGTVSCDGDNQIIHTAAMTDQPPAGYTAGPGQVFCEGWVRVLD